MLTKNISVALVAMIVLSLGKVMAQSSKDSTAVIFVAGACEMCEERIEKAAMERKGVKSAVWDVNTQKLTLVYNPAAITLEKIQCRIADRGHDNDFELAKDAVYNALPACCRYRELNASPSTSETGENKESNNGSAELKIIKGVVLEENRQGGFVPLAGASVVWLGTNTGTVSDSSGVFSIRQIKDANRLIISYTGYTLIPFQQAMQGS